MELTQAQAILKRINLRNILDEQTYKKTFSGIRNTTLYPSSASIKRQGKYLEYIVGGCNRASWYRLKGIPETDPSSVYSKMIMAWGNMIEDYVCDKFTHAGIMHGNQVPMTVKLDNGGVVSGKIDAVIIDPLTHNNIIVEIKTYSGTYKHKKIDGGWLGRGKGAKRVIPSPSPENLMQVALYLHFFADSVVGGKLFYLARDDAHRKEFDVICFKEHNEENSKYRIMVNNVVYPWLCLDDVYARYDELMDYFNKNEVPPRDYSLVYSKEELELRYQESNFSTKPNENPIAMELSKTAYTKALTAISKNKKHDQGHWRCSYCNWKRFCWNNS